MKPRKHTSKIMAEYLRDPRTKVQIIADLGLSQQTVNNFLNRYLDSIVMDGNKFVWKR